MANKAKSWTISGLAVELKRSQRAIAKIIDDNAIPHVKKGSYKYYRMADIVKAIRDSQELDLTQEKALLCRETRRRLERINGEVEKRVIRRVDIEEALEDVASQVIAIFAALPGKIKKKAPALREADCRYIAAEIQKCADIFATIEIPK